MNIYIGYEEAHPEMYEVCKASIERFSSLHIIKPLNKKDLIQQGVYSRPYQGEATDFSFTRFLVPYLNRKLSVFHQTGEIPKLPEGMVKPTIVAGVNALGR